MNPNTAVRIENGADALVGTMQKLQDVLEAEGRSFHAGGWRGAAEISLNVVGLERTHADRL